MSGVIEVVSISPESAVNENDDRMRAGSRRQAEIAELQRVLAVGDPRVRLGRRERQDLLGGNGSARAGAKKYSSSHRNHSSLVRGAGNLARSRLSGGNQTPSEKD